MVLKFLRLITLQLKVLPGVEWVHQCRFHKRVDHSGAFPASRKCTESIMAFTFKEEYGFSKPFYLGGHRGWIKL